MAACRGGRAPAVCWQRPGCPGVSTAESRFLHLSVLTVGKRQGAARLAPSHSACGPAAPEWKCRCVTFARIPDHLRLQDLRTQETETSARARRGLGQLMAVCDWGPPSVAGARVWESEPQPQMCGRVSPHMCTTHVHDPQRQASATAGFPLGRGQTKGFVSPVGGGR